MTVYPSGRVVAYHSRKRIPLREMLPPHHAYLSEADSADPQEREEIFQKAQSLERAFGNGGPAPLGLSSVVKSVNPRAARGSGGISSKGRQRVKDAAYLLEEGGRDNLTFLTLTIPPGMEEELLSKWARVCHHMIHSLTRELRRSGLPGDIVYVTEVQEGRAEKYGKEALHLHYLFCGRKRRGVQWAISTKRVDQLWGDALRAVLGRDIEGSRFRASGRIEKVKKSAVSYLGKYMSKGCTRLPGGGDERGDRPHPPSWYGLSRNLLRLVCRRVRRIRGSAATRAVSFLLADPLHLLKFNRWVFMPTADGSGPPIAWYGDLIDPRLLDLLCS